MKIETLKVDVMYDVKDDQYVGNVVFELHGQKVNEKITCPLASGEEELRRRAQEIIKFKIEEIVGFELEDDQDVDKGDM